MELALQRSKMRTTTAAARLTAVDGVEVDVAELRKHGIQKVWHGRMELETYFRGWAARAALTSPGWLERVLASPVGILERMVVRVRPPTMLT